MLIESLFVLNFALILSDADSELRSDYFDSDSVSDYNSFSESDSESESAFVRLSLKWTLNLWDKLDSTIV